MRSRISLDKGWRFLVETVPAHDGLSWAKAGDMRKSGKTFLPSYQHLFEIGFADKDYDDSLWTLVDVPHDWTIESHASPDFFLQNGFLPGGVAWYRKSFELSEIAGERIAIEFDGIFRNATVWVNDHLAGRNESGYMGFSCDITDLVNKTGINVVVVRVDASKKEGWFYEGAGLYRHVWLTATDSLYSPKDSTFVHCRYEVAEGRNSAIAEIETRVTNEGEDETDFVLVSKLICPNGSHVAESKTRGRLAEGQDILIRHTNEFNASHLWSMESPYLYTLETTLYRGEDTDMPCDRYETPFGVRSIRFDADSGFYLNNERVKIKGFCCHQSHSGLGSALPDALHEFRILKLKEIGCNAIRFHYPVATELLDYCDRLGMLVLNETRVVGSNPEALGQLERMVKRDRNHPCVIMWSMGNEEFVIQGEPIGKNIMKSMRRHVRKFDRTRPVTVAINRPLYEGFSKSIDVQGFNYVPPEPFHLQYPGTPVFFSEGGAMMGTRGVYDDDEVHCYLNAYDRYPIDLPDYEGVHRGEKHLKFVEENDYIAGTFLWTGFDYRGEPTPYKHWPCIGSHFGVMDACGYPKDSYFYYKSWWQDRPVLHLLPHWNWPEGGKPIEVWAFGNCERVVLRLNGKDLGERTLRKYSHAEWHVPYSSGRLEAFGYIGDTLVSSARIETTGLPAAVQLEMEYSGTGPDGIPVVMMKAAIVDETGRIVPDADNEIVFESNGGWAISGVGNGDPTSHEPEKAFSRRAFKGLAQAIVVSDSGCEPEGLFIARSQGLSEAVMLLGKGE